MQSVLESNSDNRLGYLDGLRGLAALWVIIGHTMHAIGWSLPFIGDPSFAVDLFMILSGFLMYYHGVLRQKTEPPESPRSWIIFWLRRYWRIAPAYYVVFFIAILIGPFVLPWEQAGKNELYATLFTYFPLEKILLHLTFLYGLVPKHHAGIYIPDWSLTLEMQFYAVFPFLFLMMKRWGVLQTALIAVLCSLAFWIFAGGYMAMYYMPSFLMLKLNMFVAGMLLAAAMWEKESRAFLYVFVACILAALPIWHKFGINSSTFRAGFVVLIAAFALQARLPVPHFVKNMIASVLNALGNRLCHFLGEASYGVYLLHPIIMFPVTGYIVQQYDGQMHGGVQVLLALAFIIPLSYGFGWIIHLTIEKPGIRLGRKIISSFKK